MKDEFRVTASTVQKLAARAPRDELEKFKSTQHRFALLNTKTAEAIDNVNDALLWGGMTSLRNAGFRWVEVPTLTKITGACENVDTLYAVEHFGRTAYLAQTGQLYLESKIPRHEKVWTVITSSRAEREADARHLNQFQLLEFEHQGGFEALLQNIEKTVGAMFRSALENAQEELVYLGRDVRELEGYLEGFNRITYSQGVEMLHGTPLQVAWGADLKSAQEAYLVQQTGSKPLFITHYPKAIKFFNMRQNDENPLIANSADLILPYSGESGGSAERENNYARLVQRLQTSPMFAMLQKRGVQFDEFGDYLQLIKENPVLHSGCGIGFGRVSQSTLGFPDIRMVTGYPLNAETLY